MKKLHISKDTIFEEDKEWKWIPSHIEGESMNNSCDIFTLHHEPQGLREMENVPTTPTPTPTNNVQVSGGFEGSGSPTTPCLASTSSGTSNSSEPIQSSEDDSTSSERPQKILFLVGDL